MKTLKDFSIHALTSEDNVIAGLDGEVVLAVNVASQCGLTPQYAGLQKLQTEMGEQGFTVLGFPCNQFGAQEPGTADEIVDFCRNNYAVTFPLTEKIDVNGSDQHPIYEWLQDKFPGDIEWNFEKFLIDRSGRAIKRYPPATPPDDPDLLQDIADLL